MKDFKKQIYILAGIACFGISGIASATPMGALNITDCTGTGVTVTATTIDWLPAGGGTGCIKSDTGTDVIYTGGGPLLPGDTTGLIKDLPAGSNLDFMIFTDMPNLHFDLTALGPGVNNTTCAATLDPNLAACSVIAGSPFILSPTTGGTHVALAAMGIVTDTTGASNWNGNFETSFPNITPAALADAIKNGTSIPMFCSGGACTDSYAGTFAVTISATTPEPGTISMFLLAGVGLIGIGRKRFVKR